MVEGCEDAPPAAREFSADARLYLETWMKGGQMGTIYRKNAAFLYETVWLNAVASGDR